MFDVFYFSDGRKPNLFPHEKRVDSFQHAQKLSRTRFFWIVHYLADYGDWDWLFEPAPWQADQRHAWASQWQPDSGTYLVPRAGYIHTNYHADRIITRLSSRDGWHIPPNIDADSFDFSWHPLPSDHYQHHFPTQWQSAGGPVYNLGADSVKLETAQHAVARPTNKSWTVPLGVDPVDQSWHPNPFDPPYIYQFGTQHQRTGGPVYTVSGATDIKYVDQIRATTNRVATAVYEIDHLCGNAGKIANTTRIVRYFDNYRDTLIRIAKSIGDQHEFVWICSSICDYTGFDFSWHPEQWQATMLHVFRSNDQKFGDTFFMHVPTFAVRAEKKELLEWYDVNFVDISVPRNAMPVIVHSNDSQVDAVKTADWSGPLAMFTNYDYVPGNMVTVPLWREEIKTIVPVSDGAGSVVVPKVAVPYIKTQLYDYAHIDRTQRMLKDSPLDIVFISNGEINAEDNWMMLENRILKLEPNKLHRVDGINGRVAAYHAAAQASTTPWFFAVFAKLTIDFKFDWRWQPDRMQQAKHYIFHARNPVNGLIYGHQAMIAYNRQLVLDNPGVGLDFTLDSPHEVVPILSGVAHYNTSPWSSWRTAFRECIKLKASLPDVESEYRLGKWLDVNSDEAEPQWSRWGAEDAVEYYDSVGGDFEELKKSYEWSWLATYAFVKRNLLTNL
jgi:hypothetical protein